jgi:hypothetical protein
MRMLGRNFCAAQFTPLYISFAPDELAERSKRILVSRLDFIHHWLTKFSNWP